MCGWLGWGAGREGGGSSSNGPIALTPTPNNPHTAQDVPLLAHALLPPPPPPLRRHALPTARLGSAAPGIPLACLPPQHQGTSIFFKCLPRVQSVRSTPLSTYHYACAAAPSLGNKPLTKPTTFSYSHPPETARPRDGAATGLGAHHARGHHETPPRLVL